MKPLEQALNEYLRIRRSLGFRLRQAESSLRNFVAFLQAEGASYITRELALRWATQPTKAEPSTWAGVWVWSDASPSGTAPSSLALRFPLQGFSLIVTDVSLLTSIATRRSKSSCAKPNNSPLAKGLRAHTYTTLFGLLVATGMRVNEASIWTDRMSISSSESFTSGGRSLENHAMCRFIPPP